MPKFNPHQRMIIDGRAGSLSILYAWILTPMRREGEKDDEDDPG